MDVQYRDRGHVCILDSQPQTPIAHCDGLKVKSHTYNMLQERTGDAQGMISTCPAQNQAELSLNLLVEQLLGSLAKGTMLCCASR